MTEDDATPEALLKRAMDALQKAETIAAKAPQRAHEWAAVSHAASEAGRLAVEILQTEPRTVVVDGLSERWRADLEKAGMECRDKGCARGHTYTTGCARYPEDPLKRSEIPADAPADHAGTSGHPPTSGDAQRILHDLFESPEDGIYRTIIAALLQKQGVVSEYLTAEQLTVADGWKLEIRSSRGAIALRIDRM